MLYSIIIPHKNAVALLGRLLQSIPRRQDLEILVVDDNSSAQELKKLVLLREQFSFDLYINTRGRGAGGSRNVGLDHARGEYVLFADADDFFGPALADELDRIPHYNRDLLFYKVNSVDSETYVTGHRHLFFNALIQDYKAVGKLDILYKYSVPWGKVYRRSFLEKHTICFAEVMAGNDMWFSCRSGLLQASFAVLDVPLYTVTVREGSIVNTVNPAFFKSRFLETLRVNDLLREHKRAAYQYSVLYFISSAHKFRLKGFVAKELLRHRSNLLIGMEKVLTYRKVLVDRENRRTAIPVKL